MRPVEHPDSKQVREFQVMTQIDPMISSTIQSGISLRFDDEIKNHLSKSVKLILQFKMAMSIAILREPR